MAGVRRPKSEDEGDDSDFWLSFTSLPLIFKHSVKLKHKHAQSQAQLNEMIKQAISEVTQIVNPRSDPNRSLLVNLHYCSQYDLACYFIRSYCGQDSGFSTTDAGRSERDASDGGRTYPSQIGINFALISGAQKKHKHAQL